MGRLLLEFIEGMNVYQCINCESHLTQYSKLISKGFTGRTGRAYLFFEVVNVCEGTKRDQVLLSGPHTICDLICIGCHTVVGWKYVSKSMPFYCKLRAFEEEQKYKEGKFILEKAFLKKLKWVE